MSRQTIVMKLQSAWTPEAYQTHLQRTLDVVRSASLLCHEVALFWNGLSLWALEHNETLPPFNQTTVDNMFAALAGTKVITADAAFRTTLPTPEDDERILQARHAVQQATPQAQPLTRGKKRKKPPPPNVDPDLLKLSQQQTSAEERKRRANQCHFKTLLARFHPLWPRSGTKYDVPCRLREQLRITMLTNAKNSLFMPYYGRQCQVLQWQLFAPTPENQHRLERWATLTEQKTPLNATLRNRLRAHLQDCINGSGRSQRGDELFRDVVAQHRAHALFQLNLPISDKLLQGQSGLTLAYYRFLLHETLQAQAQRQVWLDDTTFPFQKEVRKFRLRAFSLLPLRNYKHAHIPLTKTILKALYKERNEDGQRVTLTLAHFLKPQWKDCVFMSTDGVRCHLGFQKDVNHTGDEEDEDEEKDQEEEKKARPKKNKTTDAMVSLFDHKVGLFKAHLVRPEVGRDRKLHVNGVDPGRTALIQASSGYTMSKGRYYNECGFVGVEDRRNQYLKELSPAQQTARIAAESLSFKLWDWTQFRAHWLALIPHREAMFDIYGARCLANNRFWSYQRKQKCLARMAKELFPTPNTVLAFGNGNFPTSYKGARSGPGASLAKYLSKRGRVVMVDEFRTSLLCNRCHHEQEHVPIQTMVRVQPKAEEEEATERFNYQDRTSGTWRKTRKKRNPAQFEATKTDVHAVLWCQHCTEKHGQNVFRNRDVNASRNIRDLLQLHLRGKGRPQVFCRDQSTTLRLPSSGGYYKPASE